MNLQQLKAAVAAILDTMNVNRDYLTKLDQQNGDGDLGITMVAGFSALNAYLADLKDPDLGRILMKCSGVLNEAAPSTLGTILSLGLMGMAKTLKGKTDVELGEVADALFSGVALIMERAKSKPGDKTILDSLCPAVAALKASASGSCASAFAAAAMAAASGSEDTRGMKSVHGRAAYYGEKSIGILDGGSVVGRLIFESIAAWAAGPDVKEIA
jgi:dihydroxyacetone kinase-like protein